MSEELFSVYWFDPDGYAHRELQFVGIERAMDRAATLSRCPAATVLKTVRRIIITDQDDYCVFEWMADQGVMFPERYQGWK